MTTSATETKDFVPVAKYNYDLAKAYGNGRNSVLAQVEAFHFGSFNAAWKSADERGRVDSLHGSQYRRVLAEAIDLGLSSERFAEFIETADDRDTAALRAAGVLLS